MKLFLLRHAEAHYGGPDFDRELTERGRESVREVARLVNGGIQLDIDVIWHSPLVRARQTAELFREAAGLDVELEEVRGLRPMDDPAAIAGRVAEQTRNVLLVGHNPHMEGLVAHVIGASAMSVPVNVAKTSFLRFRREGRGWRLRDLVTAKLAAELSRGEDSRRGRAP